MKKITYISSVYVNGLEQIVSSVNKSTDLNLEDLEDVDVTAPAIGDTIIFDGTNWVNVPSLSGLTYTKAITAHAGGGQGSATQLVTILNRVDTVASNGDSIKFKQAFAGGEQEVVNNDVNDMDVFPFLGDNFIGLAANVAINVVAGQSLKVFCFEDGVWTIIN